jgi:hypothetical protein
MVKSARQPRPTAATAARAASDRHAVSRLELRQLAARLGHDHLRLQVTGLSLTRYFTCCDCGWASSTRPSQRDALGALQHHLQLAVREWDRTGLPLPSPRLPT